MIKIYSYSALETYKSCPRKFQFTYIDKAQKDKRVNAITYLGNAVHRVLQKLYKYGADSVIVPKEKMIEMYRSEWAKLNIASIKVDSDTYSIDDYIRIGEEMLSFHFDKYKPFKPGVLIGAELNLTFNLPSTPYKFRCVIDRLMKYEDGRIEICDYKTGQNINLATSERFIYQMGIYQLAIMENYPKYDEIDLVQHYLRNDEIITTRLSSEQVEILIEQIRIAVEETKHATRLNSFQIQEGPHCSYCDFYDICPAKIHKKMIDDGTDVSEKGLSVDLLSELADRYISLNQDSREIKADLEEVKNKLLDISKSENISVFEGKQGKVGVKISNEEKLITKTEDKEMFADLQSYCRKIGLDEFFKLDSNALMKEGVIKRRLTDDQIKKLKDFIVEKESSRFSVKLNTETELDSNE